MLFKMIVQKELPETVLNAIFCLYDTINDKLVCSESIFTVKPVLKVTFEKSVYWCTSSKSAHKYEHPATRERSLRSLLGCLAGFHTMLKDGTPYYMYTVNNNISNSRQYYGHRLVVSQFTDTRFLARDTP